MADLNENRPGYKKTKMGWIPIEWNGNSIGKLVKFSGGSQPAKDFFSSEPKEGYIRLVQIRDFRSEKYKTYIPKDLAKKTFSESDIMIGRYGPPLFQLFRGLQGAYNVALIKATPREDILDKEFTWYILNRPELRRYLESLSQRTGGQTGIEMDRLKKYPFPLPPLPEQRAIARILSTWDAAIDKLGQLIAKKQALKKGLMQQLLSGRVRFPEFVPPGGTRYKETKVGVVPEDWAVVRMSTIARESSERAGDKELIVLTCSKYDGFVDSKKYFGKQVYSDDTSNYKIIRRGEFGYPANHIEEGSIGLLEHREKGIVSPIYVVFQIASDVVDDQYLKYIFKTALYKHLFVITTSGTVARRGSLRWKAFATLPMIQPPLKEQKRIGGTLNTLDQEIEVLESEVDRLRTQKKGLMQQLLTGAVRVKN